MEEVEVEGVQFVVKGAGGGWCSFELRGVV